MKDPFDEQIRDYTFGGIDGITVSLALLSGLVASGKDIHVIVLGGIISTLSGALSMGLGDYLAIDSVKERKDVAYLSAIRVFFGYLVASSVPLVAYIFIKDVKSAFKISLFMSAVALVIFGYVRAKLLNDVVSISVGKTLAIGATTFGITYQVSKMIPV